MSRRPPRFKPGWKLSLFTAALLPVLLSLGFWQLGREDEKAALQALYEARAAAAPTAFDALADDLTEASGEAGELAYRAVQLRGTYDNDRPFLLDNQMRDGRVGVEVLSPFRSEAGRWVLVNRGWVATGPYRDQWPTIEPVRGTQVIEGRIYVPTGEMLTLAEESPFQGWPRLLQALDMDRVRRELALQEGELFPFTLRLKSGASGALETGWTVINMRPETHRAYAVQWFSMALALVALFLYASLHRDESQNDEQQA